ncbi:MAG: hypothetical protein LCH32_02445 [Bacteroidetes bacterium]|nr:hypothetical protein [Bacteroidota bacterium]
MDASLGENGTLFRCSGTCNQCNLKAISCLGSDVGSSNYSTVGTVVIEATTINYVN